MRNVLLASFLIAAALLVFFGGALASEGKTQSGVSLDERVHILEEHVATLQQKVARLEQNASSAITTDTGYMGNTSKTVWRSLKKGMTKSDIRALLGEPGKITTFYGGELWYYPDALGGTVDFTGDTVSGWSEP